MQKVQKEIETYMTERAWDKLRPGDLAKSISIEAAELLENFQWDNPELEVVVKDKERAEKIRNEVADVLIYAYSLCIELDMDVDEVIRKKLEKVRIKYPAHLMKNRIKEPGTDNLYWKIKREHRQKGG